MSRRCIKIHQQNYKANAENLTNHMNPRVDRRERRLVIGLLAILIIGLLLATSLIVVSVNNMKPAEKPCPIVIQDTCNSTKNATKPVYTILFFMEDGCPFCQAQAPTIANLSLKHDITTIDLTSNPNGKDLAKQWNVTTTPTIIVLSNGNETTRFTGVTSEKTILSSFQ